MQFDEALRYLLSLGHETLAIKLGLRNTELLLNALDNPHLSFSAVQIAGTNGKGSTAAVLDAVCRAAGVSTGLYTSPHLVSITERIRIGGREISREEFAQLVARVRRAAEVLVADNQIPALPTFFEHLTAIALLAFKEAKVDLAILETGLGGRLDATTAANAELVAITPVALDHEEYLGETLAQVAAEKAAIVRPGVTAIIAPQVPEVLNVILEQCRLSKVSPIIDDDQHKIENVTRDGRFCVSFETADDQYNRVWLGLRGRHQVINVSLAIKLAEALRRRGLTIPRWAIISGIANSQHSGRLELREGAPSYLFDGAHNPAGAECLRDYLDEFANRPLTIVFGAMRDKKLERMAERLFPIADQLILTRVDNLRAALLDSLQRLAFGLIEPALVVTADSAKIALNLAQVRTPPEGLVCVTGSLYLIGEIRSILDQQALAEVAKSHTQH